MMKPHKHAELIKAWADGAEIQYKNSLGLWTEFHRNHTLWNENDEYRIRPMPKPDIKRFLVNKKSGWVEFSYGCFTGHPIEGLIITRDGETGELKSAEVMK